MDFNRFAVAPVPEIPADQAGSVLILPNELVKELDSPVRYFSSLFPSARLSMFVLRYNFEKLRPDLGTCEAVIYDRESTRNAIKALAALWRLRGHFDVAAVYYKDNDVPFTSPTFVESAAFAVKPKYIVAYRQNGQSCFSVKPWAGPKLFFDLFFLSGKMAMIFVMSVTAAAVILLSALAAQPLIWAVRAVRGNR